MSEQHGDWTNGPGVPTPSAIDGSTAYTVEAPEDVVDDEPIGVQLDTVGAGEVHLSQELVEERITDWTCPTCGAPADDVELIVDAAGGHLIWNPCRHESGVPDGGD